MSSPVRWSVARGALLAVRLGVILLCGWLCSSAAAHCAGDRAETTAAFTVRQTDGVWWLIDTQGNPFFSRGVCCVNTGISWQDYVADKPGYAAWQQFPTAADWARSTTDSLRKWGFTTIGGWSDIELIKRTGAADLAFTVVLHCGSTAGAPWLDMWDEQIIRRVDETARERILATRDLPGLIGYYSDNELGWWNAALFKMTWEHSPTSGARTRLVQLTREHYRNNWSALVKDFDPAGANSFASLSLRGRLFLRPGGNGIVLVQKFVSMIAQRYYELTSQSIRKYCGKALVLGDRYQSFFYPEVVRAASQYVDVVSTNLDVHFNDGTPARYYLPTLYELSKKPLYIGEFYASATENRSGNKNSRSAFPVVQTQRERARLFSTTCSVMAATPYIVGADWFQYYDEPTFGRDDGEDFNFGLVDIRGEKYHELTEAARVFPWDTLRKLRSVDTADLSPGIPPARQKPLADGDWHVALRDWDRSHGFARPVSSAPLADLYLNWSRDTLYAGLVMEDYGYADYYRSGRVPEEDRTLFTLESAEPKTRIEVRVGGDREPAVVPSTVKILDVQAFRSYRHTVIIRIPCSALGKSSFGPGDPIRLQATLRAAARSYTVNWNINSHLRE